MNRRTQRILLVGSSGVAIVVATVVVLTAALARGLDAYHQCETGFSTLIDCHLHWTSRTVGQSDPDPMFAARSNATSTRPPSSFQPGYADHTSSAVAHCPQNYIAKRLLCAAASVAAPAQGAIDDLVTGLPVPKPWFLRTANDSPFIKSMHVETPLDLVVALNFYRVELSKRGWMENDGAVVEPDRAVIVFTTIDGPAQLRLIHQDDRTIVDLSLRKPGAVPKADILPNPGQVKLMLGNDADEEAVITINEQTIALAAKTGRQLQDNPEIDLPPGSYKITLKMAIGAAQNGELAVAADETWDLLVGPAGVPLPMRLY